MYKHTYVYPVAHPRDVLFCTLLFSLILVIYSILIPMELLHVFLSLWYDCATAHLTCLLQMAISLFPLFYCDRITSLCILLHRSNYYLLVMFLELLGQRLWVFWFCQIAFGWDCAGSHSPMMYECFWFIFKGHLCLFYVLHVLKWPLSKTVKLWPLGKYQTG